MIIKFRVIILFIFFIALCELAYPSIPISIYCNSELEYDERSSFSGLFLREFVLPDTGPYERYPDTTKIKNLHPDEQEDLFLEWRLF